MKRLNWQSIACMGIIAVILQLKITSLAAQTLAKQKLPKVSSALTNYVDIQPLTIGDAVPDIPIEKIINYHESKSTLKAFGNKLLILDFLSTGCVPCIQKLPLFDSLQKVYGDRLQFLIVTPQKEEQVKSFLRNTKIGKQIHNLPFAVEDSFLKKAFPHHYISHIVWINDATVKAITRGEYVKPSNVEIALSADILNWPIKIDVTDYDYNNPLLIENENAIPTPSLPSKKYYSTLTNYMYGVGPKSSFDSKSKSIFITDSVNETKRFFLINKSVIDMYLKVLEQSALFPQSRMMLEVVNKNKFIYDKESDYSTEWRQNNTHCYEGFFALGIPEKEILKKIKADLDFYFGLNGRMEKRKMRCLVLIRNGEGNLQLQTTKWKQFPSDKTDEARTYQISLANIIYNLNQMLYCQPVFDETRYNGKSTYVELNQKQLNDLSLLKKELEKYGLVFKEEEREVEMFVLTEPR